MREVATEDRATLEAVADTVEGMGVVEVDTVAVAEATEEEVVETAVVETVVAEEDVAVVVAEEEEATPTNQSS